MMLKKIYIISCIFLCTQQTRAQSVEKAFAGKTNCIDIELTAIRIIPDFYLKKETDSIELTLAYTADGCFKNTHLNIARVLLDIQKRRFEKDSLQPEDMYFIKLEKAFFGLRVDSNLNPIQWQPDTLNAGYLYARFRAFLFKWADSLYTYADLLPMERSILVHYMNRYKKGKEAMFRVVNSRRTSKKSPLYKNYWRYHDDYRINASAIVSIGFLWNSPLGNLGKTMGQTGGMFVSMGVQASKKTYVHIYSGSNWGRSNHPYNIKRPDTSFTARNANSAVHTLEYGYRLLKLLPRVHVYANAGLGLHSQRYFVKLSQDEDEENEPNDIINAKRGKDMRFSWVATAGMEMRYYLKAGVALTWSGRYGFIQKNSIQKKADPTRTELQGNTTFFNLGLIFHSPGAPGVMQVNPR
jgi:hypothetical protein